MKHIKKYEGFSINTDSRKNDNFEPNDPVLDIIRDRLIDLSDDYQCSINKRRSLISVKIEKLPIYDNIPRVRFCISDILDDIIPLISHMDSEYNLSVGLLYGISYMNVTKIINKTYIQQLEDIKYSKIYGIKLSFFKRWVPKVFENSFFNLFESITNTQLLNLKTDIGYILLDVEDVSNLWRLAKFDIKVIPRDSMGFHKRLPSGELESSDELNEKASIKINIGISETIGSFPLPFKPSEIKDILFRVIEHIETVTKISKISWNWTDRMGNHGSDKWPERNFIGQELICKSFEIYIEI